MGILCFTVNTSRHSHSSGPVIAILATYIWRKKKRKGHRDKHFVEALVQQFFFCICFFKINEGNKRKASENVYGFTMEFMQTTVDHCEVHINPVSEGSRRTNICPPSCSGSRLTVLSCFGSVFTNHWRPLHMMLLIIV